MKTDNSPFNDHDLLLSGFAPLVETEPDGSELELAPSRTFRYQGNHSRRGTLILGLPGSGKTTRIHERFVTAALRHPDTSVVVFAVQSGSARQAVAAAKHFRGKNAKLAIFNPSDPAGTTHRVNPIGGVSTLNESYDIAHTLTQSLNVNSGDSEYFVQQATELLAHSIIAVNRIRKGTGTLGEVRTYFEKGAQGLNELASDGDSRVVARFANEIISGNKNSETTLAQALNILLPWLDSDICRTTSASELDYTELLLEQPGLFVLSVHEEKVPKIKSLVSVIFRGLFSWIIETGRRTGGPLPRHLLVFIDELPAAGCIPDLGTRLTATFRKMNVSVFAAAQTESQIEHVYGRDASGVLAGFGNRIYVPALAPADVERASALSGVIEVASLTTTSDGRVVSAGSQFRRLLDPGDINTIPDSELGPRILFRLADTPPFFAYMKAQWQIAEEQQILAMAAGMELPHRAVINEEPDPSNDFQISNTAGWSVQKLRARYEWLKARVGFRAAKGRALIWWREIETQNASRLHILVRLGEELLVRNATITEFFLCAARSKTQSIEANLHFLDYCRVKKLQDAADALAKGEWTEF